MAAFCLYHSPCPAAVLAELARVLHPGGVAVLVTKSRDSYTELDELVARAGLDRDAARRPSLYDSFNSDNVGAVATGTGLALTEVIHEQHAFRFTDHDRLAAYLVTSPKYQMGPLASDAAAIAAELRSRLPDTPTTTTSTVTYAVMIRS
jgi:SAM-dependent methyltransferase